jgi:hypothetical protein
MSSVVGVMSEWKNLRDSGHYLSLLHQRWSIERAPGRLTHSHTQQQGHACQVSSRAGRIVYVRVEPSMSRGRLRVENVRNEKLEEVHGPLKHEHSAQKNVL